MPAETRELSIVVLAKDLASGKLGLFTKHLDAMAKKGGLTGSVLQGVGQSFGQMLNPVGLVTSGIGMAVDVLGDAVTAAMEEEAAIATLTRAIEENDRAWDGNIDAVEGVIDARQALAFADDEQRDSLQRLVSVTGDVTKALELQAIAMDLARLRGMDLATAGDLIGKVYAGNLGTLSRYGIVLEKGTTAAEALAEIQRRAAGQAEAYADTTQGRFLQAQIAMNNAMEELGTLILPVVSDLAVLAAGALRDLGEAIGEVQGHLDRASEAFADLSAQADETIGRDLVNDAANGLRFFATGGLAPFIDKVNEAGLGIDGLGHGVGEFVNGPMELYEEKAKELAFVTQGTTGVIERAGADIAATIADAYDPLSSIRVDAFDMATPIRESFKLATEEVAKGFGAIKEAIANPPQLISKRDRMENMEARLRTITRNMREAVRANDPFNVQYWEDARAKQQRSLDRIRGVHTSSLGDVKAAYEAAGISVEGTWADATFEMTEATRKAGEAAVEHMRDARSRIDASDWQGTGEDLMQKLGIGMQNQAPFVWGVADRIAAGISERQRHPPEVAAPVVTTPSDAGVEVSGRRAAAILKGIHGGAAAVSITITPKVSVSTREVTNQSTRLRLRSGG